MEVIKPVGGIKMKENRKFTIGLMILFVLFGVGLTPALSDYPEKPINMLIAFGAGGPMDASGRAICNAAESILGQPFVVTNRPGGGGSVALALLKNEKPDGYTLAVISSTGLIRVPLRRKVPFKPLADFRFIYCFASPTSSIMVKPDSEFKTLKQLVEYARQNPGKVKYATNGAGTPQHLAMLVIAKKENINWVHIPQDGAAATAQAVMGGHVDVGHTASKYHKTGQLRALASCTQERMREFPEIPTMIDLGYDYYNDSFFGIYAPQGIAEDKIKILEEAFEKAGKNPKFVNLLDKFMMVPQDMKSKAFTEFLEDSWPKEEARLMEAGLIKAPATSPK
jgi:tripartite-type tricarboxylate transporter receptor subunit TctC